MLKIHKPNHKLLTLGIASICSIGTLLGFCALTYTPELSHAESVVYPETETRTLADITYMQEITAEICTNTKEADASGNNQYQLKDSRDNKTYWVAKLKDGNCWMTQNLALDLSTSKALTSADSDVANWTPTNNTQTTPSGWGISDTAVKSYSPGQYVYTTPTTQNNCANNSTGLSACTGNGWYDVTGKYASNVANFYQANGNSVVSADEYDAHYLAGNYYSWPAATAQSGASLSSGNAASSICPKGWQLPISNNTSSKSFGGLFAAYGTLSGLTAGTQDIRLAPLYFVYGGDVSGNTLYYAGLLGLYWSSVSTEDNSSSVYSLYFDTSVRASLNIGRYRGLSVRCIARTEPIPNNNVEITVDPTITLDVTDEVEVKKTDTNPSTTALPVLVASNQPYSVSISSASPNMTSSTSSTIIPSKSGTLTTNENAWGIKLSTASTYTQITTVPKLFYSSASPESKTLLFDIGISTASDVLNGEYSTDITITATQN